MGLRDLVLVGGGHAHVQVLRRWASEPVEGVKLTLVTDRPVSIYSGMVPGFVAGDYAMSDLEIDLVPLARRARARLVLGRALRVDADARQVHVEGGAPIPYHVASIDVGSTVRGLDLPGVREHALTGRPIGLFVPRLAERLAAARTRPPGQPYRVVVVGAGAAGMEVAFALEARLRREGVGAASITVVDALPSPLPGAPPSLVARAVRAAASRSVALRLPSRVERIEADAVLLEGGDRLPCDLPVWLTGAAAPPFLRESGLATDEHGFLRVRSTLAVEGRDDLFAAGDCAALIDHRWVPKAGVYAVREGPILDYNLRAWLDGRPLRTYTPQRDFLSLLNLGDGRALGSKWGWSFEGRWVFRLKDWIDRRFVERFQIRASDG